jgi:hypothetical protein
MIRDWGRWQMSTRLGRERRPVFLFQFYLTASHRKAASGSVPSPTFGAGEVPDNPSTARGWKAFFRETKGRPLHPGDPHSPLSRWFKLYQANGRYRNGYGACIAWRISREVATLP